MRTRLLPLFVMLTCLSAIGAANEKPVAKLDAVAVRLLIEQLGSKDFTTRERASRELSNLEEVPQALREAVKSTDPEVSSRAQTAVDLITARAEKKAFDAVVQWTNSKDFKSNEPHDPLVVQNKVIVGTDKGQLRVRM